MKFAHTALIDVLCIALIVAAGIQPKPASASFGRLMTSPVPFAAAGIRPTPTMTLAQKTSHEVFGFLPYWNINKISSIDFSTLTTLAYFSETIDADGYIQMDQGYTTLNSPAMDHVITKAHANGTKVVLTITQMNNTVITQFMDNRQAQEYAIGQVIAEVNRHGMDGVNIDFEYTGDPGQEYRDKFSRFVENMTNRMHQANPASKVSVSVYASAVKDPKIYDIAALSRSSDAIFMMAYDFAVTGADNAMPTAPLHGYKTKKYWYDVATAVDDFLTQMPAGKLILGVPWYGYDYLVYTPTVKAQTLPYWTWKGKPKAQTYAVIQDKLTPDNPDFADFITGWDEDGQVGYKAYYDSYARTWRMVFFEDVKSLGLKYDFAKSKNLQGVGMWALGMEHGKIEMWDLLREKFGLKLAKENDTKS